MNSDLPVDQIIQGDALRVLRSLPHESVQTVVTSPPYWNLRDYGAPGQYGLEKTLDEYLHTMVAVFEEVRRVLRSDGTLWLNLGDSYAGSWGAQGRKDSDVMYSPVSRSEIETHPHRGHNTGSLRSTPGLKSKDLMGIPWRIAFALQADGWYLRSDIIWHKSNPMPESVQDRPTKAHEYLFLLSKSERYFYDAAAIREPARDLSRYTKMPDGWDTGAGAHGSFHRNGREKGARVAYQRGHSRRHAGFNDRWDLMDRSEQMAHGANKRSVWTVATHPFPEAHFATFPPALVEPCILAGCPAGGIVLDPFGGSGTVGVVARTHSRHYLLIELNPSYCEMAEQRILRESAQPVLWSAPVEPTQEETA
jgi:site-specific DNA-methyltransferase (adenine-specific)